MEQMWIWYTRENMVQMGTNIDSKAKEMTNCVSPDGDDFDIGCRIPDDMRTCFVIIHLH
jgi:hypothetical protein